MQESTPRRSPYVNGKGEREPGIYTRKTKAGETVFEIGYKDARGKQKWQTVPHGGGIIAARTARRAALVRVSEERSGERPAQANVKLTFDEAADAWWEAHKPSCRPKTVKAYELSLKHLRPVFGSKRLADIEADDVARYVRLKQKTLKGWSIGGHLTVLGSVFKYANRRMHASVVNPVPLLTKSERPSKKDAKPQRALTPDELDRLIRGADEPYRLIFEFAADTGARISEVLGVTWGNIDLDEETVTFTDQVDRRNNRVPLKTERSRRTIEITPTLAAKLRHAKMAAARSRRHDLVFCTRNGTAHNLDNIGSRILGRAIKNAGLEDVVDANGRVIEHAPTMHTLRHTHGSMLVASGEDIAWVSARLGHADTNTTLKTYIHEYNKANRSKERRSRLAGLSVVAPVVAADGSEPQKSPRTAGGEVARIHVA